MRGGPLLVTVALLAGGFATDAAWSQAAPVDASAREAAESASRPATARRSVRARPAGAQAYVFKGTMSGDNLWDIAGAVVGRAGLPEPIGRNQVMVAILRANPQAFPEGNLHRIQRGLDLTVPTRAEIRREDPALAAALVAQHRKAYADARLKPQPLYALSGDGAASAALAASAAASAPVQAAALAASPVSLSPTVPAWVLLAGLIGAAGVGAMTLRAWSRRPGGLESLALEPLPDDPDDPIAMAEIDPATEVERDRQRAEAAAARLYQEDLALSDGAVDQDNEPAPLPADDPAQAEALVRALADAYEELERPQAVVQAQATVASNSQPRNPSNAASGTGSNPG